MDAHRHIALLGVESLRRRLVSLLSAGITGFAVPGTVAKLPEILTSEKIERLLVFIANDLGGIEPAKLERLLTTTRASALAELPERIALLVDHGVPREKLGKVVNGVNIKKAFCARSMEEVEETILLLRRLGGGGADLILRRPLLLNLDPATQLIPRIDFLTELAGGDAEEAARLIRKLPNILAYTVAHFELHLEFWLSVGLTREQVFKVALVYPSMFSVSRDRKLVRRVEFLRRCGLEGEDIFKFLVKAPLFLSLSGENLAKKLAFLVKIGYRHGTREMAAAVGAVTRTSCENLQGAVEVLLGYGFGVADVLAMSRRHPQVLQYNYESLEEKLEYLVGEMERDVDELLAFPAFLGYKLDDRIKHRYEVKKEVRGKGMSLNKLLSVSAERFHEQALKQQSR